MKWLHRLIGIDKVVQSINELRNHQINMQASLDKRTKEIAIHNLALGRIIAKLDPAYNRNLLSKEVSAESDRIGNEVLARLYGEHKASNPHE